LADLKNFFSSAPCGKFDIRIDILYLIYTAVQDPTDKLM